MAEGRGEVSVLSMRSALRDLNEGGAFTPLPRTPSFGGESRRNSKEDLEVEPFKDLKEERSDKGRIALKAVARTAATAFVLRDLPGQVRQAALPTFGHVDEADDAHDQLLPGAVPSPSFGEPRKDTGHFGVDTPRSRAGEEDPHLDDPSLPGAPDDAGHVEQTDHLLHWWCQKQMARCLRRLVRHPQAGPFAEPLPWEELGLDDYPEVVTEPMDLQTIEEQLNHGGYDDDDGLINPEYFWEDVSLCWDNCLRYYEGDEDVEAYQMASEMREFAEDLEDEFWEELDRFENSINQVDPALSSLAAAADVAASAVEDAAATAYEEGGAMVQDLAYMLRGLLGGWSYDAKHHQAAAPAGGPPPPPTGTVGAPKKRPPMQIGPAAHRAHLLEHYRDLLEHFFDDCDVHVAIKDLQDIETDIDEAFNTDWPEGMLPPADNVEEDPEAEADALAYEGSADKVAVEKLLPAEFLAHATQAGLYPPRRVTARSPPGSARGSGVSSMPASRRTSRAGSRCGSRVGSRRASRDRVPRLPLHSARTSKASSVRSGSKASIRFGTSSAPVSSWDKLRGVGAKGAAALVASSAASAEHSDDGAEEQAKPKVSKENLKRMLPRSRRAAQKANGAHVGDEDAPMAQSASVA